MDSALTPVPLPLETPDLEGLDRRSVEPEVVRAAVACLVEGSDWAALGWSALLVELARRGATDVAWARPAEGHVDALRILAQAGRAPQPGLYAVWASRSQGTGPAAHLVKDGWRVSGTLRFASGIGVVDRALLTAVDEQGEHLLLDVDVSDWVGDPASWRTDAMAPSRSWTVEVDAVVPASGLVGAPGWYLRRPAFAAGGVGVAAVWWGATARAVRVLEAACSGAPVVPERSLRWGHVRTELTTMGSVLAVAGQRLGELLPLQQVSAWDEVGDAERQRVVEISGEARAVVATSALRVVDHLRALAGPAVMALDPDAAHAVADLEMYLAQHPVDRGAVGLGQHR